MRNETRSNVRKLKARVEESAGILAGHMALRALPTVASTAPMEDEGARQRTERKVGELLEGVAESIET